MRTGSRVFFMDRSQQILVEFIGKSNDRRPEATVNVGHFGTQQPTNQHVRRSPNGTGRSEDFVPLGMSPPTAMNAFTGYCLGQNGNGSTSTFEDDPM
jgi:hypothetical protein